MSTKHEPKEEARGSRSPVPSSTSSPRLPDGISRAEKRKEEPKTQAEYLKMMGIRNVEKEEKKGEWLSKQYEKLVRPPTTKDEIEAAILRQEILPDKKDIDTFVDPIRRWHQVEEKEKHVVPDYNKAFLPEVPLDRPPTPVKLDHSISKVLDMEKLTREVNEERGRKDKYEERAVKVQDPAETVSVYKDAAFYRVSKEALKKAEEEKRRQGRNFGDRRVKQENGYRQRVKQEDGGYQRRNVPRNSEPSSPEEYHSRKRLHEEHSRRRRDSSQESHRSQDRSRDFNRRTERLERSRDDRSSVSSYHQQDSPRDRSSRDRRGSYDHRRDSSSYDRRDSGSYDRRDSYEPRVKEERGGYDRRDSYEPRVKEERQSSYDENEIKREYDGRRSGYRQGSDRSRNDQPQSSMSYGQYRREREAREARYGEKYRQRSPRRH